MDFPVDTVFHLLPDTLKRRIGSNSALLFFDAAGSIVSANSFFTEVTGLQTRELVGTNLSKLNPAIFNAAFLRSLNTEFELAREYSSGRFLKADINSASFESRNFRVELLPLQPTAGNTQIFVALFTPSVTNSSLDDKQPRLAQTVDYLRSQLHLERALEFANLNLFRIDPTTGEGTVLYSSSGQTEFLKREEWIQLVEPEFRDSVWRSYEAPGPAVEYAFRPHGNNPQKRWLSQAIIDHYSLPDGNTEFLCISRDITKEREYAELLSGTDALTGTLTINSLENVFNEMILRDAGASLKLFALELIAYDTDKIRETGCSEVDVLREIYRTLFFKILDRASLARSPLSRAGLILLSEANSSTLINEILLKLCDEPIYLNGEEIFFSVRCVCTDYPADAKSFDGLLENLRNTLEVSLLEQRSFRQYQPTDIHHRAIRSTQYLSDIENAFTREEFQLYLQPKVSADENAKIVGVEALLRWHHPVDGILTPDRFIDLLLHTHHRRRATKYILRRASTLLKLIQSQDPRLHLAINLNASDLIDLEVIRILIDIQSKFNFPKGSMILELSEAQTAINRDTVRRSLAAVKELGYGISLDDFGQEMSSLHYLVTLPLDEIKLDKAFINETMPRLAADKIIQFVAEFASVQGWTSVLEGIETDAQAEQAKKLGINKLQGYRFGKAKHPDEFLSSLSTTTKANPLD